MLIALLGLVGASFQVHLHGPEDAQLVRDVTEHVRIGSKAVEKFFSAPFRKEFKVEVYTDRAGLDELFRNRWKAPPTEKWMVAAGVADGLFLLSPKAWKTEAVEHPGDAKEVREVVIHELVHVYHAQQNPRPEFDGMDEMAWLVEGVATYASGQLKGREGQIRQAIDRGEPKNLSEAWKGQARYAVSGSIVRFVDATFGRKKLFGLLRETTTAGALKALGTDEAALLRRWRDHELKR